MYWSFNIKLAQPTHDVIQNQEADLQDGANIVINHGKGSVVETKGTKNASILLGNFKGWYNFTSTTVFTQINAFPMKHRSRINALLRSKKIDFFLKNASPRINAARESIKINKRRSISSSKYGMLSYLIENSIRQRTRFCSHLVHYFSFVLCALQNTEPIIFLIIIISH